MRLLFTTVVLLATTSLFAQQPLFVPRDVQAAYKKQTRSADGMPGKNYWQNKASYKINIVANPPDRIVRGTETIQYENNSPDSLRTLVIKLFLNIHKAGAPRNYGASPDYLSAGMKINNVTVNGEKVNWRENPGLFTWQNLRLKTPLAPKASLQVAFDWEYEISKESGREGMIDSTTYFMAYFYPRVAVYDDYNGWDRMDFTDSREFYSDFNTYDVTVNVPANYIVWGTGTLQQPEKLLQPEVLQRYQQSLVADDIINIATLQDVMAKKVTTQNASNAWRFTSTNIPDVAFGISDHYVWDGGSVVVDDATKRRASAQAAYNDTAKDYHHVARFARHSLNWFSHHWPGIAYPYEKTTIFQGYADMEYPMMANNSTFADTNFSRFVAEHEIAHTYMPFYMGINETRYGSMDEGWATAFELLVGTADMGAGQAEELFKQFRVQGWVNNKSSDQMIPIIYPADALEPKGFGNNIYGKAAVGYLAVKDLLGDALFKKCLHAYMDRWNGKHPIPWDFFNSFNDVSGQNLNWFWNKWFFEPTTIDYSLQAVKATGNKYQLIIINTGGMPAPVNVVLNYKDGSKQSLHQTPAIWQKNQQQAIVTVTAAKAVESIVLEGGIYMDANTEDNTWKTK
jgi:hypothetical protein